MYFCFFCYFLIPVVNIENCISLGLFSSLDLILFDLILILYNYVACYVNEMNK